MSRTSLVPMETGESFPGRFYRAVIVENLYATDAEQAHEGLSVLDDSVYKGDRRVVIHTRPKKADTQDELANTLKAGDVVIAVGGDRTAAEVTEVTTFPEVAKLKVPVVATYGGNAHDFASMLNGSNGEHSLLDILELGKAVEHRQIQRETTIPGQDTRHDAANIYFGYGLSALISHKVGDPDYRKDPRYQNPAFRKRHENVIGVKSWLQHPEFTLLWHPKTPTKFSEHDDYRGTDLLDLTVANGPRMGKRDRVFRVELAEQRLFVARMEPEFLQSAVSVARMAVRRTAGLYLETGEELAFTLMSKETWTHADGDAEKLPKTTTQRIRQSRVPYLALSMTARMAEDTELIQ